MANVDAVSIIKYIQAEIKMLKHEYHRGKIDIATLQKTAKHLNNVVNFVAMMANRQSEQDSI